MSNTIDERVVKMQFDNASFEKNVQTSLSTIANLKNALNFGKVDLSGIASNIEKITDKVTGMGGIWDTICHRMVNLAVDTGQKIANAFVFNPPSDGFKEYELKMNSLKVIMESSHSSLEEVNKYLNELNKYSDQTIYSFSDMTASIGKFTNAGVDLETSVNAIKGIANEAALAGASTNDASRAMYNFAQALSAGSVKLIDWKSIENANMATKDFKEELIKTAVELGTLKKSGDDYISTTTDMQGKTSQAFNATKGFNDSLAHQWMTTDVLTTTLGRYADETTDVGARATKAATEVRTFSAMMDALKEAVGSGWAQTWEIIFGNMEEATEFWTSINDVLSGFIGKFSDARNTVLQGWKDLGGRAKLIEGLTNVFHIFGNVLKPLKDAITLVFPPITAKNIVDITNKFAEFTGKIREATEFFPMKIFGDKDTKGFDTEAQHLEKFAEKSSTLGKTATSVSKETKKAAEEITKDWSKVREAAKAVINGDYGNDSYRKDSLKKAGFDPDEIQAYVDKVHELSNGTWDLSDKTLAAVEKSLGSVEKTGEGAKKASDKATDATKKTGEEAEKTADKVAESTKKTATAEEEANATIQRTMNEWRDKTMEITDAGNLLTFSIANGMSGVINLFKSVGKVLGVFGKAWGDSFSGVTITMDHLVMLDEAMGNFVNKMSISEGSLNKFYDVFKSIFTVVKSVRDSIVKMAISALPVLLNVVTNAITVGGNVLSVIGTIIGSIAEFVNKTQLIQNVFSGLSFVLKEVGSALSFVLNVIGYLSGVISSAVKYVATYINNWHTMEFIGYRVAAAFRKLKGAYVDLKNQLTKKLGFTNFDEFTEKADKVVEKLKGFLIPAFQGFMGIINDFARGRTISFDFFKGFKGGSIFSGLIDFTKEQGLGKKIMAFYNVVRIKLGNIVNSFKKLFIKKQTPLDILGRLIPYKKEQTFAQKLFAFYQVVAKNLKDILSSFVGIFIIKKKKDGFLEGMIPLKKEHESVSKIINFFNKARELIHNAISGMVEKLAESSSNSKTINLASAIGSVGGLSDVKKASKDSEKPLNNLLNSVKNVKTSLSNIDLGEAFKKAFSFLKEKAIPTGIDFLCDAFGRFEMFVAKLDFKKLLLAAKTLLTVSRIFNGIKLAKSFSGMADSIGGFFDSIGNKFGKAQESKTTSLIKIAASIALVAKAISMIASIPEDRLDSSVGVVAGIAVVLSGLAIALGKIKSTEGSDLGGATKYAISMAVSVLLIAKAIATIGAIDKTQLRAAEEAIAVVALVLTAATIALSRTKGTSMASVAGPIGFALALHKLAKTIAFIGDIPDETLKKGEKNISKIGRALAVAMVAIGMAKLTPSAVFAPLAFAVAVFILATQVIALGMLPFKTLLKGAGVIKFLENTIKSAMTGLGKAKIDPGVVAAPLAFAAGVFVLGRTVAKLGKLDLGTLAKGIVAVGFIAAILVGTMKLLTMATKDASLDSSILKGMVVSAASIFILGYTVARLGKLDAGTLAKGIVAVGFIAAILSAVVIIVSKYATVINPSVIAHMIATAFAISILAVTVALVGLAPLKNILKGIVVVGAVASVLVATLMFIRFAKINKSAIVGLIPVVLAIVTLSITAALIGLVPLGNLLKGTLVVGAMAALIIAAMTLLTRTSISISAIFGIIAFVLAINELAMVVLALGVIPKAVLLKGLGVVLALGAVLTASLFLIGNSSMDPTKVVAIIAFMASIQALCFSVLSIGVLPISVIAKGLGVITALAVIIDASLKLIGNTNFGVIDIVAPLALVGAILILAFAVVKIGSIDLGTLAKGLGAIGLITAGLVIALRELSAIMGQLILMNTAIPALMAFVAVIGVLSYVVTVLGKMTVGDLGKGLGGLVVIVATMVIAFKLLSAISPDILIVSAAFMVFGIAASFIGDAFIKVSTALLIFTQALLMFTAIKSEEQFAGLAAGLATLSTVLIVFIGIVVGFVAILAIFPALIVPLMAFAGAMLMIGAGLYLLVSAIEKFIAISGQIGNAIVNAISSIINSAGQILSLIGDAISKAIQYIVQNAPVFMEKAGGLIKAAVSGIAKNGPNIVKKVGEFISNAVKWIQKNLPKWLSAGKDLILKLVAGIAAIAPKIPGKVLELLSKGISAIQKNLPKWLSMGKELISKLIMGLISLAGKIASEAGKLAKKALQAIKNKVGEWKQVGKDMASGLAKGIMSKASQIAEKAKSLVKGAIDAAKKKLDSNSPSKVFIKIGEDIDNGLLIGIDNNARKAASRSRVMAERVMLAAKKPLDTLADLLSGDIVTDPTITPTMDLSEIQNDTRKLYSMMSDMDRLSFNGNITLADNTNRSVTADQRRKEQSENDTMSALINAINGLSALIGNTGNVYNVNGVTYDDGSNVSSAVRSLIRAAKIEGRA